jgi:hypothetical protein
MKKLLDAGQKREALLGKRTWAVFMFDASWKITIAL